MMKNILKYKDYFAKIEYSVEDNVLHGKIEGINDLVTFESSSAEEIEKEFQIAVDDYLIFCEDLGVEPDKTYKGSFNVRIDSELHKKAARKALENSQSLNNLVGEALAEYLDAKS